MRCQCVSECECQCECAWGGLGANWFSGAENQEIYVGDTLAIKIIAGMCCLCECWRVTDEEIPCRERKEAILIDL